MYYSAEIAVDHITDHLPFRSTRKQWTWERRRARFSERKGAEKVIFSGNCPYRFVWEQDAAGSNPVTRTISSVLNQPESWMRTLDFFALLCLFVCMSRNCPALFVMPIVRSEHIPLQHPYGFLLGSCACSQDSAIPDTLQTYSVSLSFVCGFCPSQSLRTHLCGQ